MKHVTIAFLALCMLLVTIGAASAALTEASWQANGIKQLTIEDGESATFDWYAISAWSGFTVDITLNEGGNELWTLYTASPHDGYAGGPLAVGPSLYADAGTYTISVNAEDCVSTHETELILIVEGAPEPIPPKAAFDWSATYLSTTFTDQSSDADGTIVSYYWTFGDGSTSTAKNPAHVYSASGDYVVTLKVTDNDGLTDTVQKVITVTAKDNDFIAITVGANPTSGTVPLTVSFTCTATGGDAPIAYKWNFGDGVSSSSRNPAHIYNDVGTYTAICTATDDDGDTISGSLTIKVNEQPPVNLPPEMEPIDDQYVNENTYFEYYLEVSDPDNTRDELTCYDAEFAPISALKYAPDWLKLDESACKIYGTAPDVNNDLQFRVRMGVRDPAGLNDEEEFILTVKNVIEEKLPVADFTWSPDSPLENQNVQFVDKSSDEDGTIVSYYWTFGDGKDSSVKNPIHAYAKQGQYKVTFKVKDNDGLTATKTRYLTVRYDDHEFNHINVGANPSHGYAPLSVSFTCTAVGGDAPVSYSWTFGDGDSSSARNPTHVYQNVDTYTATCTAKDNDGDKISGGVSVKVTQRPPENLAPSIGDVSDHSVDENTLYSLQFVVSDPDGDDLECFTNPGAPLPSWLTLDVDACRVYGTSPEVSGDVVELIEVGVRDPENAWDSTYYYLTVVDTTPEDKDFTGIDVDATPRQGYAPLSVSFTCTAYGGDAPISYRWAFGDGSSSSARNPTHVYDAVGVYTPTCMATDDDGDKISGGVSVKVTQRPPENLAPSIGDVSDHSVDENTLYSLQFVVSDPDGDDLECFTNPGAPLPSWLTLDVDACRVYGTSPEVSGDVVELIEVGVRDPDNAWDSTYYYLTVVDTTPEDKDFTDIDVDANPRSGRVPLTVAFSCTATGGDAPVNYRWTFGDGDSSSARNPTHVYDAVGVYTATCTATDDDGDTISGDVDITVSAIPPTPLYFDEFGCNPDVVQGHLQYCSVKVIDDEGDAVAGVDVTMKYYDPISVQGAAFGSCVTDSKGYCHDTAIVTYDPGHYTLEAKGNKAGNYLQPRPAYESFLVWEKRYNIIGLEVYDDETFSHPEDTFYRGEDMYVAFAIHDDISDEYVCDEELVQEVFLRVNNENPLHFVEYLDLQQLTLVEPNLIQRFLRLFGVDVHCTYEYWLREIPLTDDYLGDGRVFAFTFNFSDNTAGQASKPVNILNNPVEIDLPQSFTIAKYVATDTGSIDIDLKQYVSDVETLPEDMVYAASVTPAGLSTSHLGNGVYRITAASGFIAGGTFTATADDTDGSTDMDTARIIIDVEYDDRDFTGIDVDATPDAGYAPLDVDLSCETSGGNAPVSYVWSFGDGTTGSGQYPFHTYSNIGTYTATCTATDNDGDTISGAVEITVERFTAAPVAVAGPDQAIYRRGTITMDGSSSYDPDGGDIVSYVWDFGDGTVATGATVQSTYTQLGTYTVTLTVTDDEGDTDTDTLTVTVSEEPYVPSCMDGKDNDNDGLIDMDDPGCEHPRDPTEYNFGSSGAEYGIDVVSISTYGYEGYERAIPGDIIVVEVVLENEIGSTIEDLRVGFSVPELGVKQKSSMFDVRPGKRTTETIIVYLPYDAEPGEYYTEITVSNGDLRRSLHRSLEVIEE